MLLVCAIFKLRDTVAHQISVCEVSLNSGSWGSDCGGERGLTFWEVPLFPLLRNSGGRLHSGSQGGENLCS